MSTSEVLNAPTC